MRSMGLAAVVLVVVLCPVRVFGSFHLWKFDQVFSNADGSQQFIEMSTDTDGQRFFNTDDGGGFGPAMLISGASTFSFPHDLGDPATVGHDTAGQHLLIASTGFSPKGKTADFVLPANFFSTGADTLKFTPNDPTVVLDSTTWASLPKNGTDALHQVPGTSETSVSAATAANFSGNGGGPSAVPLPPGVYTGLAGLGLAVIVIRRGLARSRCERGGVSV